MDGQELRRGLLAAWLAAVLLVTLAPFWPLRAAPSGFAPASRLGGWDFALNILLFLPAGALGRMLGRGTSACMAAAALLSLLIESAQMWIPHRHPSQLDVLANALGALAGALAVRFEASRCRVRFSGGTAGAPPVPEEETRHRVPATSGAPRSAAVPTTRAPAEAAPPPPAASSA